MMHDNGGIRIQRSDVEVLRDSLPYIFRGHQKPNLLSDGLLDCAVCVL